MSVDFRLGNTHICDIPLLNARILSSGSAPTAINFTGREHNITMQYKSSSMCVDKDANGWISEDEVRDG
ncbi:hypothetical protein L1987_80195 [Smallanthus sonchifolius]|uniref:Uncharacterized protein n=1 Tax=Smallanthus sonchifolius TaxID=185202 RepID=A0ACB8YN28_9ASTR|nr:hypothetical protein L1987_80195 [Smallanthus sonchifolius]